MRLIFVVILTYSLGWSNIACMDSRADEPDRTVTEDPIQVKLTGRFLQTAWNIENGKKKLYWAKVQAGGADVLIDPANCPEITSELVDYNLQLGGAFVSECRANIEGEMLFVRFAETDEGKANDPIARKLPPDAIIPVVRIRSVKITTLPTGRERKLVTSTTVGITKR